MPISHNYLRPGITCESKENYVTASVWAPFAGTVAIEKTDKTRIPLYQSTGGYWEGYNLPLTKGDLYHFIVDEEQLPDPASRSQPEGVHGPSQVVDLSAYEWRDQHWNGIPIHQLLIYELHTGTFSAEGTFAGIAKKLKELKKLGINTIELMPVSAFPGNRNWGYDGVFPYAAQHSYGGAYRLQKLVDACHLNGIAVMLDVVYNHLGPEGNCLKKFGPYFTDKYKTPWGEAINYDDAWSDGVRNFFLENAMMWIRDFHIDGLRLDAVHAIKDLGVKHFLAELKERVTEHNNATGNQHFLIAECDLNDVKYLNPSERGGYNLDSQWCDEFHHALHSLVTGEENGYYSDFGGIGPVVKSYNHAYVYDGIYSPHRKKNFGSNTDHQPGHKFVVFAQNHDQIGNRMLGDRLSHLVSFEMQKTVAAATLLSPFTPLIFMGEEYGEQHPFLYFVSHTDEQLIQNVRKGRKKEFKDFMRDLNPPDPQAEATFRKCILTPSKERSTLQNNLLSWYRVLIDYRKSQPFWNKDSRQNFSAGNISDKVIHLNYNFRNKSLHCFLNFGKEPFIVDSPGEIITSSALLQFGGSMEGLSDLAEGNSLFLPAESCTLTEKL